MGSELFLKLLRPALLAGVFVLLLLLLLQRDAVEARLRDLREATGDLEKRIDVRMDELREEIRKRPVAGEPGGGAGGPAERDPRALPWDPAPGNLLADPAKEPGPPPDAPRGGEIRYYTTSNPRSLNVLAYNEAELQERICAPVYEYLADQSRVDPDQFVPGVANRVTANADYTEFTCHIRKGMLWHKPFLTDEERAGKLRWLAEMPRQQVTAHDVKFIFDVVRDPHSECGPIASYLADLDRVEVVDDFTVRFFWKRSLYYNKSTTLNLVRIYPKFIYERDETGKVMPWDRVTQTFPQHWFNQKMCGTGPFQFAGFEPNAWIRLKRNDDWWDPNKPAVDGILLHVLEDYNLILAKFKSGEIDVFAPLPGQYRAEVLDKGDVAGMIERGEVTQKLWEMFTYYYVGWNLREPVLKEREVRRALAHVFPRDRIIRDVYFGLAVPCHGPVHPWESYYCKDIERFEYDPEKAARILDEAGWKLNERGVRAKAIDGEVKELRIRATHPTQGNLGRDIVQLFQKSAQQIGVVIEPRPLEWSVMTKTLEDKEFEACVLGWGNSWDSDPTQIWHSSSALSAKGSNHVSYINPELDRIIDGLKTEFDREKRFELWERFQKVIVHDQPYCFNLIRTRVWWIRNRLGNPYFAKLRPQDWFLPWFVKRP
jgi:ABC-type transport system substrate-binding protein